jgi:hypothetical protein
MYKDYDEFMKMYNKEHKVCPKCGSNKHTSTLMGYIFDNSKPDEYKDLNRCQCTNCGDQHTCHERISIDKFNELKNKI